VSFAVLVLLLSEGIALAPYVSPPVRKWVYRSGDGEVQVELQDRDRTWSDGRVRVETFDPEEGLLLHATVLASGERLEYERPVVVVPPRLEVGVLHESQRRFVRRKNGSKVDVGAHAFEAELLGFEDVSTPLGNFERCLKLRRLEVRMDFSGGQERYEATEWYAEGVGLVKSSSVQGSELALVDVSRE
jgi:hypothetical protein